MNPVHSPAPLSTAPPAGTGLRNRLPPGSMTVTPVRAMPGRPAAAARRATRWRGQRRRPARRRSSPSGRWQDADRDAEVGCARHGLIITHAGDGAPARQLPACPWSGIPTACCTSPSGEVWLGVWEPGTEVRERADVVLDALRAAGARDRLGDRRTATPRSWPSTTPRSSSTWRACGGNGRRRAPLGARPPAGRAVPVPDRGAPVGVAAAIAGGDPRPRRACSATTR